MVINKDSEDSTQKILEVELDGELLLVDWINRRHFSLNESAAFIYRLAKKGEDQKKIVKMIMDEYDVDEKKAKEDVEITFSFLKQENLI